MCCEDIQTVTHTHTQRSFAVLLATLTDEDAMCMWGRDTYSALAGKPEGTRPLGRPRCRWEASTKLSIKAATCPRVWTGVAWLGRAKIVGLFFMKVIDSRVY